MHIDRLTCHLDGGDVVCDGDINVAHRQTRKPVEHKLNLRHGGGVGARHLQRMVDTAGVRKE